MRRPPRTTAVGSVVSTGYVFANSLPDPNPANNLATVTTTITNAPLPYNLVVGQGVTSAFITWNTPYGATDQVDYGLTTAYGSASYLNTNLNTRHVVLLTGLLPDTNYYFQARSVTSGLLSTTNGSFATVSSLTLGTTDAAYTGVVGPPTRPPSSIYPTNTSLVPVYFLLREAWLGNPWTATATYVPNIPTAGYYDVYIWYPGRSSVSSNMPVIVTGATNAVLRQCQSKESIPGAEQLLAPVRVLYQRKQWFSGHLQAHSGDTTTVCARERGALVLQPRPRMLRPMARACTDLVGEFLLRRQCERRGGRADGDTAWFHLSEYVLGTDPTSSCQFLAILGDLWSLKWDEHGDVLRLTRVARNYQLLSNTNIALTHRMADLTNTPTVNDQWRRRVHGNGVGRGRRFSTDCRCRSLRRNTPAQVAAASQQQHGIAVAEEAVLLRDRFAVGPQNEVLPVHLLPARRRR